MPTCMCGCCTCSHQQNHIQCTCFYSTAAADELLTSNMTPACCWCCAFGMSCWATCSMATSWRWFNVNGAYELMTLHDGCRTKRQRGSGGPPRPQREPRSTLPVCPAAWALEAETGTPKNISCLFSFAVSTACFSEYIIVKTVVSGRIRSHGDAQDRLLWRDKTYPART